MLTLSTQPTVRHAHPLDPVLSPLLRLFPLHLDRLVALVDLSPGLLHMISSTHIVIWSFEQESQS
jgi:hypothetical protein